VPALVPAQGVLLLCHALAPALHLVEEVPGIAAHHLLLQAGALALCVLHDGDGGTGLVTHHLPHHAGGEQDGDGAGDLHGGDTAVLASMATTTTSHGLNIPWSHLSKASIPRHVQLHHLQYWLAVRSCLDSLHHVVTGAGGGGGGDGGGGGGGGGW